MNQIPVNIKGMHCRSCEMSIEDELLKLPGVKKVKVSQKKGLAEIFYQGDTPKNAEIENAVKNAGYETGSNSKPWFSPHLVDYTDFISSASILVIFYLLAQATGIIDFNFISTGDYGNLIIVLLIGLTAGLSSCMALVGGLVLGISARFAEKHPGASTLAKFRPHLFFNLGRIISFFILGGMIGQIGAAVKLSPRPLGILTMLAGIIMLFIGIQLTGIIPKISSFSFTLPKSISKLLRIKHRNTGEYSHTNALLLGALTFFLPCGFTQAMQVYAVSSGSFITGSLTMGIFALGTTPGLLGIGGLTSLIKGRFGQKFFKFVGTIVIFLALINISSGFNLTGLNLPAFPITGAEEPLPPPETGDGKQIIRMEQSYRGYTPNKFTVKKGIPVQWIINSTDAYSCASSLSVPELNVSRNLNPGQNIIEFTPEKSGIIKFTCSMGMYAGTINVI